MVGVGAQRALYLRHGDMLVIKRRKTLDPRMEARIGPIPRALTLKSAVVAARCGASCDQSTYCLKQTSLREACKQQLHRRVCDWRLEEKKDALADVRCYNKVKRCPIPFAGCLL